MKHRKGKSSTANASDPNVRNAEFRLETPLPYFHTADGPRPHVPPGTNVLPSSSATPTHPPTRWAWVPMAPENSTAGLFHPTGVMPPGNFAPNWTFVQGNARTDVVDRQGPDAVGLDKGSNSMASSIKENSFQKRKQRATKRAAEEEARRRENAGLKPYTVQVKDSGIIDSGCAGHLKWQEFVRNMTPRMLDMSVMKFEDQNEDSKEKLRETLRARFEFLEHEVTDLDLDKMIKTWIRRDRERMKRLHGGTVKAPTKYRDNQWDNLKRYWDTPTSKKKSERMSETRSKVTSNPRVGRTGYAGKKDKLVRYISPIFRLR